MLDVKRKLGLRPLSEVQNIFPRPNSSFELISPTRLTRVSLDLFYLDNFGSKNI